MENLESLNITDFLFVTVPALLVFFTAYTLIKKFIKNEDRNKLIETKRMLQKEVLPLRLQAYERLTLFLERISPNNLLISTYKPGMKAGRFQKELINKIRGEFEHNITQQIYMSSNAWQAIRTAKEEIIKLIITASASVNPEAPGLELSKSIFSKLTEMQESPTQTAVNEMKKEILHLL